MKNEYANILKYAMQMEQEGAAFFRSNAERFQDPTTKDLFLKLAKVEESHYDYIKGRLDKYEQGEVVTDIEPPAFALEESKIFVERAKSEHLDTTLLESDTPDMTILRMAYLIEKDFAEFYEEAAEYVDDESLKDLFIQLSDWEKGHESLFKKEYRRLLKEYMNLPWGG